MSEDTQAVTAELRAMRREFLAELRAMRTDLQTIDKNIRGQASLLRGAVAGLEGIREEVGKGNETLANIEKIQTLAATRLGSIGRDIALGRADSPARPRGGSPPPGLPLAAKGSDQG